MLLDGCVCVCMCLFLWGEREGGQGLGRFYFTLKPLSYFLLKQQVGVGVFVSYIFVLMGECVCVLFEGVGFSHSLCPL